MTGGGQCGASGSSSTRYNCHAACTEPSAVYCGREDDARCCERTYLPPPACACTRLICIARCCRLDAACLRILGSHPAISTTHPPHLSRLDVRRYHAALHRPCHARCGRVSYHHAVQHLDRRFALLPGHAATAGPRQWPADCRADPADAPGCTAVDRGQPVPHKWFHGWQHLGRRDCLHQLQPRRLPRVRGRAGHLEPGLRERECEHLGRHSVQHRNRLLRLRRRQRECRTSQCCP
jgi:hypothetical protein